jgi:hypothetical protein
MIRPHLSHPSDPLGISFVLANLGFLQSTRPDFATTLSRKPFS